jgi:hypothetical protein
VAPPKKSPDRRQRTNAADVGLVVVDGGRLDRPTSPSGLLKPIREAWVTYWGSEVSALYKPEDAAALRRLFNLYDASERAWREEKREPLVEGSADQPRPNPAGAKKALELEPHIRALEDRFGITPLARLKLGVTFQQGQSLTEMNRRIMEGDRDARPDPRSRALPPDAAASH